MTVYQEVTCEPVENYYAVIAGDKRVILPQGPAKILFFLLANPNKTHHLRTIVQAVYDAGPAAEPASSEQSTRVQVRILRTKLAAAGLFLDLENEPYRGYTFRGIALSDDQPAQKGRPPSVGGTSVDLKPMDHRSACADVPWTFPAYRERNTKR